MWFPRHLAAAACTAAVLASATACSDGGSTAAPPEPSITEEITSAAPEPTSPSGGAPAGWEEDFTHEELNTYSAALARWERYTVLSNEIYGKGKDTPEARDILQEYSALWQRDVVTLAEVYDQAGTRREVPPEPLWTYAKSIKSTFVVIVQCTDYSDMRITRNGEILENKPKNLVTPLVIRMDKPEGEWLFAGSTLKDETSCAA